MNPPGKPLELAPPSSRPDRATALLVIALALALAAILFAASSTPGDDAGSEFRSEMGRNAR